MAQSPFKLFEPYGSNDKNIFFGRDKEIYALYNLLKQTRLVLFYGASGTGKTSLLHAGLPKVFQITDWYRISIRRKDNINDALRAELSRQAEYKEVGNDIVQAIKDIYDNRWIPIYLIFDQFEEIFTLGNHEERLQFFETLKTLLNESLPCKIILSMREEYIGYLYEYEPIVPSLFDKRLRIEPMNDETIKSVLKQMCAANNISLESDTLINTILEELKKVDDESDEVSKKAVHLPNLQVYLHYLYEKATEDFGYRVSDVGEFPKSEIQNPKFTEGVVKALGKLGDVIKRFIETQLEAARQYFITLSLPDDFAPRLLDEFATEDGTKKACRAIDLSKTLKQDVKTIKHGLSYFDEKKLLRADEEDVERYEPVHDVIANQIHKLRKAEDKEFKAFTRQLKTDYERWLFENKTSQRFLTESDVAKVDIYRERLETLDNFNSKWAEYVTESSNYHKAILKEKEAQFEREKQLRLEAEDAKAVAEGNFNRAEAFAKDAVEATVKAKHNARVSNRFAALSLFGLILSFGLFYWALTKREEAIKAQQVAILAQENAIKEKEKAEKALKQLIITEIEKLSNRVDVITKSGNACPDEPMMNQLKVYKDTYKDDEAIMKLINGINIKLQSKNCPTL